MPGQLSVTRPALVLSIVAAGVVGFASVSSAAGNVLLEGEAGSITADSGSVVSDRAASGGKALEVTADDDATGQVNFSRPQVLVLRHRSTNGGSKTVNVAVDVDGVPAWSGQVPAGYASQAVGTYAAGWHHVDINVSHTRAANYRLDYIGTSAAESPPPSPRPTPTPTPSPSPRPTPTPTPGGLAPIVSFSYVPTSGTTPITVAFTDTSINSPTLWAWNFGDNTSSTSRSPSHTFNGAGTYMVSLTAANSYGTSSPVTHAVTVSTNGGEGSAYDTAVMADNPVFYMKGASGIDSIGGRNATLHGPTATTVPNGDGALAYNGSSQYAEVPDANIFSATNTGVITIEAWMRPDVLQFPNDEDTGYVHWLGKGGPPDSYEWVCRMYSLSNQESRPNRISGYHFNSGGGLGAGSYFQDSTTAGQWIHYALVINTNNTSGGYPNGYTMVYKNGVRQDQDDLSVSGTIITPKNGTDPVRIGTAPDFYSWFQGGIGKIAIYDTEVSAARLLAHYKAM